VTDSRSGNSLLPHFLAILYALAIVYASLQPFVNWLEPVPGVPYFLFAPWPPRWVRYDAILNTVAYLPFGFFVGLIPRRSAGSRRLAIAVVTAALLSLAMETLQMFLPTRYASIADWIANTAGAGIGGTLAALFARSPNASRWLSSARERWFLPARSWTVWTG